MRRIFFSPIWSVAWAALFLVGCKDVTETYYLNPDGSGKVEVTYLAQVAEDKGDFINQPNRIVRRTITNSKGIEAWSNVEWKMVEVKKEKRLQFKGTGYFPNIQKVVINAQGDVDSGMTFSGGREKGQLVVEFGKPKMKTSAIQAKIAAMSPEERKTRIEKFRKEWEQSRAFSKAILYEGDGPKHEVTLICGGKVLNARHLAKVGENGIKMVEPTGDKIFAALEKEVKDDNIVLVRSLFENWADAGMSDLMAKEIYGQPGRPAALFAPGKPLFDYAKESAAAKSGMLTLLDSLESDDEKEKVTETLPMVGEDAKLTKIWVAGFSSSKGGFGSFFDDPRFDVTLGCEFPGSVLWVTEGQIDSLVTDQGEDLVDSKDNAFSSITPNLTKNKFTFRVDALAPERAFKEFREVKGNLNYLTGSETELKDLGITEYAKGVKGDQIGFEIESVENEKSGEEGSFRQSYDLRISIGVPPGLVKKFHFHDESGIEFKAITDGHINPGFNERFELSFERKDRPFPKKGKIVAEIYTGTRKSTVPFSFNNLTLIGGNQ